jgi:hypothetical protein
VNALNGRSRLAAFALATIAAAWALFVMWNHAILDWYADAWRTYPPLLDVAWWQRLTDASSGHRMLTTQLLLWLDLHFYDGSQLLLRVFGIAGFLAVLVVFVRATARAADSPPWLRAQILLVLVLGVAWLGNARMLAHPFEANNVYLVVLLLALVAGILASHTATGLTRGARVGIGILGVSAAFVFGSGVALLPATLVLILIVRGRRADIAATAGFVVVAAALWIALPGYDGEADYMRIAPIEQSDLLVRWLASPMLYVGLPLVEPDVARTIPVAPVSAMFVRTAETIHQSFGTVWDMTMPQRLIGIVGVAWLAQASVAAWRGRRPQLAVFGLTLAWMGFGAGALLAVLRVDYFARQYAIDLHHQLHATRYLPWSCLFWSGLGAASLAQYAATFRPVRVGAATGVLALVALGSGFGGHVWSAEIKKTAAAQSAAAREGREPSLWLETEPDAFRAAIEPAKRHQVGPFAPARTGAGQSQR